jgi:hypothetical protein
LQQAVKLRGLLSKTIFRPYVNSLIARAAGMGGKQLSLRFRLREATEGGQVLD